MKLCWFVLSNVLLMTGNDGESMLLLRCFVALGMVVGCGGFVCPFFLISSQLVWPFFLLVMAAK